MDGTGESSNHLKEKNWRISPQLVCRFPSHICPYNQYAIAPLTKEFEDKYVQNS
jgi:hypothetical protein